MGAGRDSVLCLQALRFGHRSIEDRQWPATVMDCACALDADEAQDVAQQLRGSAMCKLHCNIVNSVPTWRRSRYHVSLMPTRDQLNSCGERYLPLRFGFDCLLASSSLKMLFTADAPKLAIAGASRAPWAADHRANPIRWC